MVKKASLLLLLIALSVQALSATGFEKTESHLVQSGLCSDGYTTWTISVSETEAYLDFRENGQTLPSEGKYIIRIKNADGGNCRFSAHSENSLIYVDNKYQEAFKQTLGSSDSVEIFVESAGRKVDEKYLTGPIDTGIFLVLYAELFAKPVRISVTDLVWTALFVPSKYQRISLNRELSVVLTDNSGYVYECVYKFKDDEHKITLELQSISDIYTITADYVVSGSLMAHFELSDHSNAIIISEESLVPGYQWTMINWELGKTVDNGKIRTKPQRMLLGRNSVGISAGCNLNPEDGIFRFGLSNYNNIRLPLDWRIGIREDAAWLAGGLDIKNWYEVSASLTLGHIFKLNDSFSIAADIGAGGGYREWDGYSGHIIRIPVSGSFIMRNGLQFSLECFTDLIFYTKTTEKTTSNALKWSYKEDKMAITVTPALVLRYTYF